MSDSEHPGEPVAEDSTPQSLPAGDLQRAQQPQSVKSWLQKLNLGSLVVAIVLALGVRTFLFAAYKIPSGSMIPTLLVGDQLIVNKINFGLRLPFADTKLIDSGDPQAGDVVVFRYPRDPSIDFIKRTLALPGDIVRLAGRDIWINGKQIRRTAAGTYTYTTEAGVQRTADRFQEENGDHRYYVLYDQEQVYEMVPMEFVVPPDSYFMMGDNRDRSNDSRVWGFVPRKNLEGAPVFIHFSWDGQEHRLRWRRMGETLL